MSDKEFNGQTQLVLSDNLRRILYSIGGKDALQILGTEGMMLDKFPYSCIDVTTSPETLSFMLSSKSDDVDNPWKNSRRTDTRCGKIFRKILSDSSTEDIEKLVNKYKSKYKILFDNAYSRFKIVEGKDIKKYYNARTYAQNENTLAKSCMRYDDCGLWMNLYSKNPQTVKMLILMDPEDSKRISARALLWDLKFPEGKKLLDRIYYSHDSDKNLFKDFAKQNGWFYRSRQRIDDLTICDPSGHNLGEYRMQAQVRRFKYRYFPFIDTLRYYHKGILANWIFDEKCIELRDNHGRFLDPFSNKEKLIQELRQSSLIDISDLYGNEFIFQSIHYSWKDRWLRQFMNAKNFMKDNFTIEELSEYVSRIASIKALRDHKNEIRDIFKKYNITKKEQLIGVPCGDLKLIISVCNQINEFLLFHFREFYKEKSIKSILIEKYGCIGEEALRELSDYIDFNGMITRIVNSVIGDEESSIPDEGPFEDEPADENVDFSEFNSIDRYDDVEYDYDIDDEQDHVDMPQVRRPTSIRRSRVTVTSTFNPFVFEDVDVARQTNPSVESQPEPETTEPGVIDTLDTENLSAMIDTVIDSRPDFNSIWGNYLHPIEQSPEQPPSTAA